MKTKLGNLAAVVLVIGLLSSAVVLPMFLAIQRGNLEQQALAAPLVSGPTHRIIFNNESVATTAEYGSVDILGTTDVNVFNRVQASTSAVITITVDFQWLGQTFETDTFTRSVTTAWSNSVVTPTATVLYPGARVGIKTSTGTITATVGVVAQ